MSATLPEISWGIDVFWVLFNTSLVVFMQAGFAAWEIGSVRSKNAESGLYKAITNAAITVIAYWILGYGFAAGNTKGGFIGVNYFGLYGDRFKIVDSGGFLFYQTFFGMFAFAAVAVTIASGAVAERVSKPAQLIWAAAVAIWIFPIIVHWCWGQGWLSPFADQGYDYLFYGNKSNNYIDASGSGVVHAFGGVAGLIGAWVVGPRKGRFDGEAFTKNSVPLATVGALILWFGWYGFNMIASRGITGTAASLAGKIAATTTLSAGFAALTAVIAQGVTGKWSVHGIASATIAGLVGISGGSNVVDMWAAMCIGIGSTLFYLLGSHALIALKIDDAVDAFPIHGAAGIWGSLAVGIFGTDTNAAFAGYQGSSASENPFRTGEQFGVQLVGILCIVAWTVGWSALVWFALKFTIGVRDPEADLEDEKKIKEVQIEAQISQIVVVVRTRT